MSEVCSQLYSHIYVLVCNMHKWGPYNNVVDKKVSQFVGSPLLLFSPVRKGESVINATTGRGGLCDNQDSCSPICMYCHKYLKRSNNHVEADCFNKKKVVVSE